MSSDTNPDFLPIVQSNDFLPPISPWTALGGLFLVATFGAALILAAITEYKVTVKASASVRPVGELRIVQSSSEGTIKSIPVKENMSVKAGDAIAVIDDSRLQTQKSQLQGNIQQNLLQLNQITAQINSLDRQRLAETELVNRTITSARADLGRNEREYQDRQITAQGEVKAAEAALELAKAEMTQYQQLANSGAIAKLQIKQKEQAFKASQARLQIAKAGLNPTTASVAIAKERIAQEKARGESTLATLNKERENLRQRQVEIQNQINSNRRELKQTEVELKKNIIRSPETGIILKLNLRNPSQVVQSGESIAEIAPSNSRLIVKANVSVQDISKVAVGQTTQLKVSAYPYPDYGILQGKVSAIAPDVITSQTGSLIASQPYYEITIQPEKTYLVKGDRKYPIQPGMEVTADIISQEDTVLKFVLRRARLISDL